MTTTTTTANDNINSNTTSSPLSYTSLNTRVPNVNKKSKTLIQGISKQRFLALKPRPSQHASITFIQNQYEEGIGITCVNFQHKNAAKHISKHDMIKVLHLSQIQACKILNCSMSTLKRKFYQMKTELGWTSGLNIFKT
ncbi:hypothetical protein C9374_008549 [Naegleria lovaniensis]|uniref:RWP-RK domain-containing protein n=1 Tax=Naegleria lovaniensis TaxID=51637 RepID=A0AA88GJM6_NAELO|nr:uncharacterized protein C9374_008549 [Naegleria lovaniensis]KAG2378406.1 hypothetical protein C9374_008549 [Naegleria lovaniensis]